MTVPQMEDSAHGSNAATKALNATGPLSNGNGKQASFVASLPKVPGGALKDIQPEDQKTKDEWVPRDPKMIRLTGRHPFNSEPPPAELMQSYITPASLHYVRNHGPVPQARASVSLHYLPYPCCPQSDFFTTT